MPLLSPKVLILLSFLYIPGMAFALNIAENTSGDPDYLCYSDEGQKLLFSIYNHSADNGGSLITVRLGETVSFANTFGQLEEGENIFMVDTMDPKEFAMFAVYRNDTKNWSATMSFPVIRSAYNNDEFLEVTCEKFSQPLVQKLDSLGY